jgi:hypothetical protein
VINRTPVLPSLLRRYAAQGAEPVDPSLRKLASLGVKYIEGDLLQQDGVVRHDQGRLTRLLLDTFVRRAPHR